MSLNGIDISGWQKGINLSAVPADFVMVKATQGTSFVSDQYRAQADQTIAAGKMLGVYHYVGGQGADAEAKHFANNFAPYKGRAVPAIDWESNQNSKWGNTSYLDSLVKAFIRLTGIKPLIYCSSSSFPWAVAKDNDCGTWVAQYADNNATGYQETPWNEGKYACTMRQYSSHGRLTGYSGNLDLNKFYGDKAAFAKYMGSTSGSSPSSAKKSVAEIASEVIAGQWGNGDDRKKKIESAGYDYSAVQAEVNKRLKNTTKKTAKKPKLAVDGSVGPATTKLWQQVMGTTVDGVISGQSKASRHLHSAIKTIKYGRGGSELIRAVQRKLGIRVDGLLGPDTIRHIQNRLGVTQDGSFGPQTARALQQRLNEGRF